MPIDYRKQAIQIIEKGPYTHAYFIDAGAGWGGGYLVYTKAGKGKPRKAKHTTSRIDAERQIKDFMESLCAAKIDAITEEVQRDSLPDLTAMSLLAGFTPEGERRYHAETQEDYTHLRLGSAGGADAQLFDDGVVILLQGGFCVSLDDDEATRMAMAILGRPRPQNKSYERIARIMKLKESEACHE